MSKMGQWIFERWEKTGFEEDQNGCVVLQMHHLQKQLIETLKKITRRNYGNQKSRTQKS